MNYLSTGAGVFLVWIDHPEINNLFSFEAYNFELINLWVQSFEQLNSLIIQVRVFAMKISSGSEWLNNNLEKLSLETFRGWKNEL